jgi:Derlin-2/3
MNARQLHDVSGPESWYSSLPFVTKNWLTAVTVTTVSANLGVLPLMKMVYDFESIFSKFEIWRIVTPFLWMGPFNKQQGFQTVIGFFLLYQYSKNYESGSGFNTGGGGGTADYIFMLMFGMAGILLVNLVFPVGFFFAKTLIYYVLYIWSKRNPTAPANIWGVPMQGMYLPFALLALSFCLGNSYVEYVHGYAIGHLYYFLADVVPKVYGKNYLRTPLFIISRVGVGEYVPPVPRNGMGAFGSNVAGGGMPAPGRVNAPRDHASSNRGHNWGSGGQRLGSS